MLFTKFLDEEIQIGKHRIDLLWRNVYIELKTGRALDGGGKEQLAAFSKFIKAQASSGFQLAYVFLEKPTKATIKLIRQSGGEVFYIFG